MHVGVCVYAGIRCLFVCDCGPVGCDDTVMEESECRGVGPPVWAWPLGRWPWITLAATGSIMTLQALSNDTCRAQGYTPGGTDSTALQLWIHNEFVFLCVHMHALYILRIAMYVCLFQVQDMFVIAVCVIWTYSAKWTFLLYFYMRKSLCVIRLSKKHTLPKGCVVLHGVLCMRMHMCVKVLKGRWGRCQLKDAYEHMVGRFRVCVCLCVRELSLSWVPLHFFFR